MHHIVYVLFMMLFFGALAIALAVPLVDAVLDMFTAFPVNAALLAMPVNVWLVESLAAVSVMTNGAFIWIERVDL
jgi:hypothetical protein